MWYQTEDLTGQKFNRLTALKMVGQDRYRNYLWLCECDCAEHTQVIVRASELKHGRIKSCGCLRKENSYNANKKFNEYYVWNDIVFVKYSNCNEYFICDLEDWENLKEHCWLKNLKGYAATSINNKTVRFHQLIVDCPESLKIDHIYQVLNGVCDNRKINLRCVTTAENNQNHLKNKKNKSGYNGVHWDKRANKWRVSIGAYNKTINLGCFDNLEDAVKAREEGEKIYWRKGEDK